MQLIGDSLVQAHAHDEAAAAPGALHVSTFATRNVSNAATDAQGNAVAPWSAEAPGVASGHAAGELGTFTAAVAVQGGLLAEINGLAYADTCIVADLTVDTGIDSFAIEGFGRRTVGYDIGSIASGQESFTLSLDNLPFAFGRDIRVTMELRAISGTRTFGDSDAKAEADYSHTMTWSGLSNVRDSAGNLVTDFTAISADSGFNVANPTPVPEPGSAGLFALGLVGVGGWMRRNALFL